MGIFIDFLSMDLVMILFSCFFHDFLDKIYINRKRRRSPAAPKPQRRRKQRWDVRPEELDHDDEKDTVIFVLF